MYTTMSMTSVGLGRAGQARMDRQREWEARFTEQLQKREQAHADSSWLQSMPQHCVQESRAKVRHPLR